MAIDITKVDIAPSAEEIKKKGLKTPVSPIPPVEQAGTNIPSAGPNYALTSGYNPSTKTVYDPTGKGTIVNLPRYVGGVPQGSANIQTITQPEVNAGLTTPSATGLKSTTAGNPPAAYANPAVVTPAPIPAPNIPTTVKQKGLFEQAGDWYSKLNPSQQDSANKALIAAGFNLMQTGGTTYRQPISNAALFGQAGTVGLKTYEADQTAKAKAASDAEKLKFDQEYKTATLGLRASKAAGRGGSGNDKGWQLASKNAEGQFAASTKMTKAEDKQYASLQPGQVLALSTGVRIVKGKSDADTQYLLPGVPMKMNRNAAINHLTTGEYNKANPSAGGTGVNSPTYNQNPYLEIGGRQIPISRINEEAKQHGVAPETYVDTLIKLSNK